MARIADEIASTPVEWNKALSEPAADIRFLDEKAIDQISRELDAQERMPPAPAAAEVAPVEATAIDATKFEKGPNATKKRTEQYEAYPATKEASPSAKLWFEVNQVNRWRHGEQVDLAAARRSLEDIAMHAKETKRWFEQNDLTPAEHEAFVQTARDALSWSKSVERVRGDKGKIERSFQDLERAGVLDRTYESVAELQAVVTARDLQHAQRVHGTVGERPGERFERERAALTDLPALAFDPRVPETRKVLSDCCVSYGAAFYSVPHQLVGSKVVVKADPLGDGLEIFAADQLVARHQRVSPRGAPRSSRSTTRNSGDRESTGCRNA